jgi:hypothetical protein
MYLINQLCNIILTRVMLETVVPYHGLATSYFCMDHIFIFHNLDMTRHVINICILMASLSISVIFSFFHVGIFSQLR